LSVGSRLLLIEIVQTRSVDSESVGYHLWCVADRAIRRSSIVRQCYGKLTVLNADCLSASARWQWYKVEINSNKNSRILFHPTNQL